MGYRLSVMTLREQVEQLLPDWESWYPSLFDAARDLGVIRARICDPSSLLLSNRHAGVQSEAARAYREQWSIEDEASAAGKSAAKSGRKRRR
ncbi:MAG: hypothetical protein ACNA8J_01725 [Gammaproteobacteria bacterium]